MRSGRYNPVYNEEMINKYGRRTIAYVIGLSILALGIALAIRAGLGTGAWDALYVGFYGLFGLTVGSWVIIVGFILVLINALLLWERLDWLALGTLLLLGVVLDGWLLVITWEPTLFWQQGGLFLISMFVISLGVATYLQANFAPTSVDKLMYAIHTRTGFSLRLSKTIGEVIALVIAWLIGGPIGIGTVMITFLVGPLVQFFLKVVGPLFTSPMKEV
ncbi:YitT family protein [Mechercharimyces sp. CAU 1602]|uniref:YczE/YyaS/YitT family protein n=1 Tax=Mechercharimyces sp. CAU 1602 TaxID=2973933 RepID=UPI002162CF02|nr:membrane protein [Mechercharimyces sp. CAU 1602]MCS1350528.1 membrane protein [Mechercharimyces sp. CAU 1602]